MSTTYGTMYHVADMKAAVDFYKKLGLEAGYQNENWTEFEIGGHNLCLHSKAPGQTYPENGILILNRDGIKALFNSMKNDGYNVFGLHEVHPEAWSFHLKDQDNNEISYYGKP